MEKNNNCTLLRRLASIFYDSILLSAVLFFSALIILLFTGGQAIASGNIAFDIYLIAISYLYFTWQWTHGGQTLGMRAWKIRLEDINYSAVSWRSASLRFVLAGVSWILMGAGFLWSLIDRERLAFHDKLSGTRLKIITNHDF